MTRRNWCSQCGQPYLDADWQPTRACGPSHAIIARELADAIAAMFVAAAALVARSRWRDIVKEKQ